MSIDQKQCRWLDFPMQIVYDPEHCEKRLVMDCSCVTSDFRNIKLLAQNPEPQYITLQGLTLVHVQTLDNPYDPLGIKIRIDRTLQCKNGCTPAGQLVPECWHGSGMMLPAGEYEFSIEPQIAIIQDVAGFCKEDMPLDAGLITLLFEPADKDQVTASIYNGNLKSCIK